MPGDKYDDHLKRQLWTIKTEKSNLYSETRFKQLAFGQNNIFILYYIFILNIWTDMKQKQCQISTQMKEA